MKASREIWEGAGRGVSWMKLGGLRRVGCGSRCLMIRDFNGRGVKVGGVGIGSVALCINDLLESTLNESDT